MLRRVRPGPDVQDCWPAQEAQDSRVRSHYEGWSLSVKSGWMDRRLSTFVTHSLSVLPR